VKNETYSYILKLSYVPQYITKKPDRKAKIKFLKWSGTTTPLMELETFKNRKWAVNKQIFMRCPC